jgi:hypothetical protein
LTGTQTLTNKTISGADNTLSNIGNSSLTNSSITINGTSVSLGGTRTLVTDDIAEDGSPSNLWYTDTRSRAAISVTDAGGDGSLSYNSGTGVITYTGPSATEVRAHFSAGTGVAISSGQISIGQAVATTDNVTFAGVTADNIRVGVTAAGEIDTSAGNLTLDSTGGTTVMDDDVNVTGNLLVDGNLTVSGTTVTINTTNLAVEDNMIYLNNGSTVSNPDLGFAGNYNDGTYRHAGIFRDASDGVWKFYHQYTPEPDASAYIDITHGSFALAAIQAASFTGSVTGNVTGNASTATAWQTARTLTLSGDVTGTSAAFDGSGNISITTTIAADSVALGTDTTGNYVASITNGSYITGADGGSEGAGLTLAVDATSANTASKVVARDSSGNFAAGTITAALSGNASTATTLQTARNINGVSFNGSADITVTAAAGTLSGSTLASGVTASSLTSVGTLTSLTVSGDLTVDTNTLKVDSANNRVGVGVASPISTLMIGAGGSFSTVGGAFVIDDGSTSYSMRVFTATTLASGISVLDVRQRSTGDVARFYTGTTQTMTLDNGGNLGIGTTSPASYARLAVLSGASAATAFFDNTAQSAYSATSFFSGSTLGLRTGANATGNATGIRFASNANGALEGLFAYVQNASATGDFVWQGYNGTAYAERMRLNAAGYLGIGTASPATALDVINTSNAAQVRITGSATAAETTGLEIYTGTTRRGFVGWRGTSSSGFAATGMYLINYDNSPLIFGTTATEAGRFSLDGNFSVGTTSQYLGTNVRSISIGAPAYPALAFYANDVYKAGIIVAGVNWTFGTVAGNHITFEPGGSEKVVFKDNGWVGIGTGSPANRLHIVGANTASRFLPAVAIRILEQKAIRHFVLLQMVLKKFVLRLMVTSVSARRVRFNISLEQSEYCRLQTAMPPRSIWNQQRVVFGRGHRSQVIRCAYIVQHMETM